MTDQIIKSVESSVNENIPEIRSGDIVAADQPCTLLAIFGAIYL